MSIECPNGCSSMPMSCPIKVNQNIFAQSKAIDFEQFDGIKSTEGEVRKNPVIICEINQDRYSTHNHFKNREAFQSKSHIIVEDVGENTVKLEFLNSSQTITAMECPECDTVYDPDLNQTFENPEKIY